MKVSDSIISNNVYTLMCDCVSGVICGAGVRRIRKEHAVPFGGSSAATALAVGLVIESWVWLYRAAYRTAATVERYSVEHTEACYYTVMFAWVVAVSLWPCACTWAVLLLGAQPFRVGIVWYRQC